MIINYLCESLMWHLRDGQMDVSNCPSGAVPIPVSFLLLIYVMAKQSGTKLPGSHLVNVNTPGALQ